MNKEPIASQRLQAEAALMENYLDTPTEALFAQLFKTFTPQLIAFFRSRCCDRSLAEDLAQQVMLTVHLKSGQIRDRKMSRQWLFSVAHNALRRHYDYQTREVETVNLDDVKHRLAAEAQGAGMPAFEFEHWMAFLDSREREAMTLRFIEQWEYHEIAAAQAIPIGTVQWRIFNAKRKLAPHLTVRQIAARKAA